MKSFAVGEQESFGLAKGAPALGVPNIIKFATSLILLLFKNTLLSNPPLDRFVQIS
jgi:hypothetical protein